MLHFETRWVRFLMKRLRRSRRGEDLELRSSVAKLHSCAP